MRHSVPPNCKFEVDDIEKEWLWEEKFDLIFARSMIGSISSWETFFKKAYEYVIIYPPSTCSVGISR